MEPCVYTWCAMFYIQVYSQFNWEWRRISERTLMHSTVSLPVWSASSAFGWGLTSAKGGLTCLYQFSPSPPSISDPFLSLFSFVLSFSFISFAPLYLFLLTPHFSCPFFNLLTSSSPVTSSLLTDCSLVLTPVSAFVPAEALCCLTFSCFMWKMFSGHERHNFYTNTQKVYWI